MDLQAYLRKRYAAADRKQDPGKKKKKIKKKESKPAAYAGVKIVDDDAVWQKPVESESDDEEAPAVVDDEEVRALNRLEELRSRPYLAVKDDGSGWVDVTAETVSPAADSDKDVSPPRRRTQNVDSERDISPPRRKTHVGDSDGDISPPRKRTQIADSDSKRTQDLERDSSPPRRALDSDEDISPPRRRMQDDLSPPRKRMQGDLSPPRKRMQDDLSPPRKRIQEDLSPPRKRVQEDLSPPRKRMDSDTDNFPPRKRVKDPDKDISPPRIRRRRMDSDEDISPPRRTPAATGKTKAVDRDASPPRRNQTREADSNRDISPPRRRSDGKPKTKRDLSPPRRMSSHDGDAKAAAAVAAAKKAKMTDGSGTGLIRSEQLIEDAKRQKKEDMKKFAELSSSVTGRGAETVYRDKHGRRLEGLEELMKQQQSHQHKGAKGEEKEKALEWGKGLIQKREAEKRNEELAAEMEKPFARSKDDPDLDAMLKKRIRWGDPMAHLVVREEGDDEMMGLEDLSKNEMMRESGFVVPQEVPAHSWLKRKLGAVGNRYGIKPGRHWDGVDRSNGFEKDLFKQQNERKATQDMAHLWSVADM